MNPTYITPKLVMLTLVLLFLVIGIEASEEVSSGFSGKVVDLDGNPVADFIFAIEPMQRHDGFLVPENRFSSASEKSEEGADPSEIPRVISKVQTDSDGTFVFTNVQPGLVRLSVPPNIPLDKLEMLDALFNSETFPPVEEIPDELMQLSRLEPDKRVVSIQVGRVTFFYTGDPDFSVSEGLTFALEPGGTIEDVKITVKSRLQIRGRVIYTDGTPLANAEADLTMEQRHEFLPNHGGTHGTNFFTDADGYFTQYMDEPGFYTLSVEYNDLSAGMGPFLLKDGVQPPEIVLTLEGKPDPVEPPADNIPAPGNIEFREPLAPPPAKSVWIINPTNGHAYKTVHCEDWQDAQRKAVAEGAHLVSINDEAEQQWLEVIFRHKPFWIGLTDVKKEGEWQWDSGEPVTYTNWATQPIFPDRLPDAEKDYVVVTFRQGAWQSAGPESPLWRMARWAVIEKDGLLSTIGK